MYPKMYPKRKVYPNVPQWGTMYPKTAAADTVAAVAAVVVVGRANSLEVKLRKLGNHSPTALYQSLVS